MGFANGNNIGFKYAKNELNSDFIILANNDTLLTDSSFCSDVIKEYNISNFAALGPKIKLKDNSINPINYPDIEIDTLEKQLRRFKLSLICDKIIILYFLKNMYQSMKKLFKKPIINKPVSEEKNVNLRHENVMLHGCFLIFSRNYINLFEGLNDKTFLYREEELLYKRLKDNNLKIVYNPNLLIIHNEDSATNAMHKTNRKKSIFVNKNRINSTKILIDEIKGKMNEK